MDDITEHLTCEKSRLNAIHLLSLPWLLRIALLIADSCCAETVVMAVSTTPLSLPLYVAHERGYFARRGISTMPIDCAGGHPCAKQMLDGFADFAISSDFPVVFNGFERAGFVVVGTIASTSTGLKLLARPVDRSAASARLQGRRIGSVPGTSSQYFLDLFLLTSGIDPRGVVRVSAQPKKIVQSMRSGQLDAVAIWEPIGYNVMNSNCVACVALSNPAPYIETFNLLARRQMSPADERLLVKVLAAVEEVEQFTGADASTAKAILRRRLGVDEAFTQWIWPGLPYRLSPDQSLLSTMEGQARWARREGHVGDARTPDFRRLIYSAPLRQVNPAAVTLSE